MKVAKYAIRMAERLKWQKLISACAPLYLNAKLGQNCSIVFDGLWWHGIDGDFFPDEATFCYTPTTLEGWGDGRRARLDASRDYWFYWYEPRAGDVILDIGAGKGYDSLLFSRAVGPTGKVLAVEAHPTTFQMLLRFCHHNQLSNTLPAQIAVCESQRRVRISDLPDDELNTICEHYAHAATDGFLVDATTLDALCADHQITAIDYLKINIEGAETMALEGMKSMLGRTRYVTVACHDFLAAENDHSTFRSKKTVVSILEHAGFEVATREGDPRDAIRCHVHGRKS
jgi:FkbM family methyltransferase